MPTHKLSRRAFLGLAAMALAGCCPPPENAQPTAMPSRDTRPTTSPTTPPTDSPTPGASLEAEIGQMLMIGFRGLEVNDDHFIVRDIRERNLGGVVLFDYDAPSGSPVRNIESPAQVQALVAALQAAALQAATDAEIVLHTEPQAPEIDFKVQSADAAAAHIEAAGGRVAVPPFDIQIGRCTVVQDPWGNEFVLLDASKGLLVTDEEGNVVGNAAPQASADDTTVR